MSHLKKAKQPKQCYYPDSKVHGAYMGPTCVLSDSYGPHVGPRNLVIRVSFLANLGLDWRNNMSSWPIWLLYIIYLFCWYSQWHVTHHVYAFNKMYPIHIWYRHWPQIIDPWEMWQNFAQFELCPLDIAVACICVYVCPHVCVCVSQLWPSSSLNSPVHLSCPSGSSSLVEGLIRLLPVVDYFHFVIQSHYCRSIIVWSLIADLLTAGAPTQKVGTMLKALEWMCWHMTDDCSLKKYFSYIFLWWCPSVYHTCFTIFLSSYHHEIFRRYGQWQIWCPCRSRSEIKGQGVKTNFVTIWPFPDCYFTLNSQATKFYTNFKVV